MAAAAQIAPRPKLLFVDDEQRVLNSMRIMFRRDFDLYLASHGDDALKIIRDQDIDVIVADHRMPQMTGVEVLTRVRILSPRTVRILLTGYADLDAVEGSINEGEVFRFLTKPCPPRELREVIGLAAQVARANGSAPESDDTPIRLDRLEKSSEYMGLKVDACHGRAAAQRTTPGIVEQDETGQHGDTDVLEQPPMPPTDTPMNAEPVQPTRNAATGMGVVVFTSDDAVLDTVHQAVRARLPVYAATNIVQVVKALTEHRPGVLVTDISEDRDTIQSMTARLKEHLPELVTITVSEHRDVLDMVWLINHGQIFRFLRKPLSPGRCAVSLQAALKHHRMLLRNPELVTRHEVSAAGMDQSGMFEGMLERLKSVRRFWASV